MLNDSLRIPAVDASDAGEFTCVARNIVGEDVDHIGLFVGSPPIFLQRPRGNLKITKFCFHLYAYRFNLLIVNLYCRS